MQHKLYYYYAASCFFLIFMFLCYVVSFYPEWLQGFDQTIQNWLRADMPTSKTHFFLWVTKFANPISIIMITLATTYLLYQRKEIPSLIWFCANVIVGAGLIVQLFKHLIQRARPALPHLVSETSFSFPSGHASGSMFCFGALFLLIPLFIKNVNVQRLVRLLLVALILLIGASRIYLGVHYPSDILGGFTLGLAGLLASWPFYQEKRAIYKIKHLNI